MPAGRVLLAQGTSEWGVEYKAGSTGGEHEHQLSVGELPSHGHEASTDNTGEHYHMNVKSNEGGDNVSLPIARNGIQYTDQGAWRAPSKSAGIHSHSVTVDNTGEGLAHNNMQPYLSCYMWRRTT